MFVEDFSVRPFKVCSLYVEFMLDCSLINTDPNQYKNVNNFFYLFY